MNTRKFAALLTAAALMMCCAGCGSKKNKDKKKTVKSKDPVVVTTADEEIPEDVITTSEMTEPAPTAADGKYITKAYELLQSGHYSVRLTYTDPSGHDTEIYRLVNGADYYEIQKNEIGESGCICVSGYAYDFDNVCGIFRKRNSGRPESLIESVVEQKLPATDTNIDPNEAELYEAEEYTYTGGTYITVIDFYFDKTTGLPVKYITKYMVEEENGDEGMTETRTVKEICVDEGGELHTSDGETVEKDSSLFDLSFLSQLADFDSMTPEQKLGYCQAIFVTAGVTADELNDAQITDERLKYISYEDFTSLVYTFYNS